MHGAQLRKFGFRFFFSEGRRDIDQVTEIGASRYLSVPSYQIDRGIFENYLAEEATRHGVRFVDGALVRRIDLAEDARLPHRLDWTQGGETHVVHARWLIDACGRAGMLKRKLGLAAGQRARLQRGVVPHRRRASPSTTGPTTPSGARAASRRRAGSRPTTWSAPATGSG